MKRSRVRSREEAGSLSAQQWCSGALHHVSKSSRTLSVACGLAGTGALLKLKILSCCMGKTSWGVAQGTALAAAVTLTKSPEIRQPGHGPDPHFGCVSLLLPPGWRQDTQCVTGEYDNPLWSLPRSPGQRGAELSALQLS